MAILGCLGSHFVHYMSPHLKRVTWTGQLSLRCAFRLHLAVYSPGNIFTRNVSQTPNMVRRKPNYNSPNSHPGNGNFLPTKGIHMASTTLESNVKDKRLYCTIAWILAKPLAKILAIIFGRIMRKKFGALSTEERRRILQFFQEYTLIHCALLGALLTFLCIYYIWHIEKTPITGRKVFVSYTKQNIAEITQFQTDILVEIFKEHFVKGQDQRVKRAINVAKRILNANPVTETIAKTWTIYIINDPIVNAFVLPNGHIFVFSGSLTISDTDDQLAIILGHEMAHAVLRHGLEGLSRGSLLDWFLIIGFAVIWFVIPYDILACVATIALDKGADLLISLPASRKQEWEADHVGLIFAANACYDVREAGVLWRKIAKEQDQRNVAYTFPVWTGTHPDSHKRADFLDSLLADAEGWRKANGCPPLPNKRPLPQIHN